jgi:hypothetical protein
LFQWHGHANNAAVWPRSNATPDKTCRRTVALSRTAMPTPLDRARISGFRHGFAWCWPVRVGPHADRVDDGDAEPGSPRQIDGDALSRSLRPAATNPDFILHARAVSADEFDLLFDQSFASRQSAA